MGRIYYMMGKSASGKDTLYKLLLNRMPELKKVVIHTTRPKREGEREGVEYFFDSQEALNAVSYTHLRRSGSVIALPFSFVPCPT